MVAATFDEGRAAWDLTLDDGSIVAATAVVCAVGQLGRPGIPDIPGRELFAGPSWHSARWDHAVDLTGRRVAVVGTGASVVQFVPEIAAVAAHVDVYQRSAPYVLPKSNQPYRGVRKAVFGNLSAARKADRLRVFLYGELLTSGLVFSPRLLAGPRALWQRQFRAQVTDPELRAKCVPDYVLGCKRVAFSSNWYPALARPDVSLVTDPTDPIGPGGTRAGSLALPKRLGKANMRLTGNTQVTCTDCRESGMARRSANPSDLVRAVVDEVSWYMSQHKVSRAELAQSMGVSPGRVSQILSGDENLTLRTLSSVVSALGAEATFTLRPAAEAGHL